jgi:hypothetical protein
VIATEPLAATFDLPLTLSKDRSRKSRANLSKSLRCASAGYSSADVGDRLCAN